VKQKLPSNNGGFKAIGFGKTKESVRQTELVAEMPVYPQEGYIQQVGDIVIVKVSEDYLIDE